VEIQEYFRILWKRGWIVVLVALITATSAYGFSKQQTPIYKGIQQIHFEPGRADWGLQMSAKDQLPIYRAQLDSDEVAWKVIDRLGLDLSPSALRSKIRTGTDEAAFSLVVEALDPDPEIAKTIARTFAEVFKEERDEWNMRQDRRDRVHTYIRNDAQCTLHRPKTKINTLAGGIFGIMLGVVIVFFLEWLESDIVRTAEDVERHVGIAVLGSIPAITSEEVVPVRARRKLRWSFLRSPKL
jgi:capsular polysaccharide biosynthesis protein